MDVGPIAHPAAGAALAAGALLPARSGLSEVPARPPRIAVNQLIGFQEELPSRL
jgi:hypothetical protein